MADISGQIVLNVNKAGVTASASASLAITMSGVVVYSNVQTVGIAHEALELSADIGDPPAILMVKNTDPTNFVELALGADMTNKFAKLLPGQCCLLPPSSKTLRAQANTAPVSVQVVSASL